MLATKGFIHESTAILFLKKTEIKMIYILKKTHIG